MQTNSKQLPKRLNCAICEGAWFCYVLCLFVPVAMMFTMLIVVLLSVW